jgi:hypothetical protein
VNWFTLDENIFVWTIEIFELITGTVERLQRVAIIAAAEVMNAG